VNAIVPAPLSGALCLVISPRILRLPGGDPEVAGDGRPGLEHRPDGTDPLLGELQRVLDPGRIDVAVDHELEVDRGDDGRVLVTPLPARVARNRLAGAAPGNAPEVRSEERRRAVIEVVVWSDIV
jgi:hypothetical protein